MTRSTSLLSALRGTRAALAVALFSAVLAACGGGGSSAPAPAETLVTPIPVVPTPVVPAPVAGPPSPTVQIGFSASPVFTGQASTLAWTTSNASVCTASGAWSGAQPGVGSIAVALPTAGSPTYTLTCSGAGGTLSASATLSVAPANVLAVTVDHGPTSGSFNMPFVSVTVCVPGTQSCRTVDHVLVDTGSQGLRLMASALDPAFNLPVVGNAAGAPLAECGQFASGFTWGSVRRADVRLAGEQATAIPVQVIGDAGAAYATVPSACRGTGTNIGSVDALGANGVLGVGNDKQDCGSTCVSTAAVGVYYACPATGCTGTTLPLESQVVNPVAVFPVDNNGLSLTMPAVPVGGLSTLSGTLTFGLGTQANNQMGNATVYTTSNRGTFTTQYKGTNYTSSFIDSGSNGNFFDDSTIAQCSSGFYCPASPLFLSAVNVGVNGASGTVNFIVEKLPTVVGVVALNAAGTAGLPRTFDWGLPFFFGRTVSVAITGATTPRGTGPFWAY
jgi:hypothetical protein